MKRSAVPDVSVIVAVYNTMPYLNQCLNSLIEQSIGLGRLEIVAVDDGSTDGSPQRLDDLARQYPDVVKVIHQPNSGGPAVPSNRALDVATGRYVFFLGADDYLGREALARLVTTADKYGADVVAGRMVGVNGRYVPSDIFRQTNFDVDLYNSTLPYAVSNTKLFRRELIEQHGLRFPENLPFASDQPFTVAACVHAKRIAVLSDYDFYYAVTRDTRSNITFSAKHDARLRCTEEVMNATARLIEPGPQRDAVIGRSFGSELWKMLQRDFPLLDRDMQEHVCAGIAKLSDAYLNDNILRGLSVRRRVRLSLARRGLVDDLVAAIRMDHRRSHPPMLVEDGRLYAAYECFRNDRVGLPDWIFELTRDPAELIAKQVRVKSVRFAGLKSGHRGLVVVARSSADFGDQTALRMLVGEAKARMTFQPKPDGVTQIRAFFPVSELFANCHPLGERRFVNIQVDSGEATCDVRLAIPSRIVPKHRQIGHVGHRFFSALSGRDRDGNLYLDFAPMPLREVARKVRTKARQALGKRVGSR